MLVRQWELQLSIKCGKIAPEHFDPDLCGMFGLCIGLDNFILLSCKDIVPDSSLLDNCPLSYYAHEIWTTNPTLQYRASKETGP